MTDPQPADAAPAPALVLEPVLEPEHEQVPEQVLEQVLDPGHEPVLEPAPSAAPEPTPAQTAARLAELFPALFGGPPRPLKLRIQADIQVRAPGVFTKRALSAFLHRHTTSTAYLKALVAAPQRLDLDGAPAGEPAPEHLEAAKAELERRRGIVKARRDAEAQAHRDAERAAFKAQRQAEVQSQREQQRQAAEAHQSRWVEDNARRERAQLLRAFESSPLNKANFCVLKRISEAELDAQLGQARADRAAWQAQNAPAGPAPGARR